MTHKTFYYARIPEGKQSFYSQLDAFQQLGAQEHEVFIDQQSEKNAGQNSYQLLKKVALREGDTLVIPSLDHLSDHKETVQKELQWLRDSDIRLKVLDMPTTMVDFPEDQAWAARLINDVLIETFNATVAQEYTEHKQKQREGIDAAKAKGIRFGRPPIEKNQKFYELKGRWETGEISTREAAKILGVSHQTFWKWVR